MSLSIDSRMEQETLVAVAAPPSERMEEHDDDSKNLRNGIREADNASDRVISNRFLHSDENLDECQTTDEDEDDDNNDSDEEEERGLDENNDGRQAAFLRGQKQQQQQEQLQRRQGDNDAVNVSSNNNPGGGSGSRNSRSPYQWANRQLHRSVSVDDLMEYQREFRLEEVGRASSAYDLTDYQREFQAILAEQQYDCVELLQISNPSTDYYKTDTMGATTSSTTPTANHQHHQQQYRRANNQRQHQRSIRNSIANSDLAEFKRQFCQERAARTMRRAISADDAKILKSNNDNSSSSSSSSIMKKGGRNMTVKLNKLIEEDNNTTTTLMNYQWGTRSLRRAILGSDLGRFERTVRTALIETSRENSSAGSVDEDDGDNDNDDDDLVLAACNSSSSSLGMNHRDSQDLRRPMIPSSVLKVAAAAAERDQHVEEREEEEEDWGTRSLRKSLKELDLLGDPPPNLNPNPTNACNVAASRTSPYSRPKPALRLQIESVQEDELELPLDANISSPWKDERIHPSSNGLKMPRRVTSGENAHHHMEGKGEEVDKRQRPQQQQQHLRDDANNNLQGVISKPPSSSSKSRSVSLNDIGGADGYGNSSLVGGGGGGPGPLATTTATNQSDEPPEFEWQLRSRFRRSISSSDIEKYQRHFDGAGMMDNDSENASVDTINEKDSSSGIMSGAANNPPQGTTTTAAATVDDDQLTTQAPVSAMKETALSPSTTAAEGTNGSDAGGSRLLHPLLVPSSHPLITADDNQSSNEEDSNNNNNDDSSSAAPASSTTTRPRRSSHRRHRRSTSDEPELHMDSVIADVAPRKPTRTTSRPISPPPPRSAVVRFAEDKCNQVVEIPKVSDDMKPYLFYTKRDVKRFRMNEHRRQEEQIRSYMEYLNQKENALDASPCIFD